MFRPLTAFETKAISVSRSALDVGQDDYLNLRWKTEAFSGCIVDYRKKNN